MPDGKKVKVRDPVPHKRSSAKPDPLRKRSGVAHIKQTETANEKRIKKRKHGKKRAKTIFRR